MYNSLLFNTALYNTNGLFDADSMSDNIEFNGFSLQNSNIVTSTLLYESMPSRALDVRDIPRGTGRTILSNYFRAKQIVMRGNIKDSSACLLDQRLDSIKKNLNAINGELKIKNNCNEIKVYEATLTNPESMFPRQRFHIDFVPFEFIFDCYDPFGKSTAYNVHEVFSETTLSYSDIVNNAGTFKAKANVVFNFTAASSVTALNFTNNTNGNQITITQSISTGDVIEINSEEQYVRVNGSDVDYDGVFQELETGDNSFTVTVTGTSATWTLSLLHKTTYL